MATVTIRPRQPNGVPIYVRYATAQLIDSKGEPAWGVTDGRSFSAFAKADVSNGTYTFTLQPNSDDLNGTYYIICLSDEYYELKRCVRVPREGDYDLEDVAVLCPDPNAEEEAAGTTPVATGTGLSEADRRKLDSIESGAEVNVNADWLSESGDSEILNKPVIPQNTITADERTKLEGIEEGAQVNVKPDWGAVAGTAQEILNRPDISGFKNSVCLSQADYDALSPKAANTVYLITS